jgi:hypothetical protein
MHGSIWGSILVSGLAGFIVGYGVLWLARGSWVARTFLAVLTVACFITSGVVVKMAFQSAHSESLAPVFFFAVGIYAAAVGAGLLISIFFPVHRAPQ